MRSRDNLQNSSKLDLDLHKSRIDQSTSGFYNTSVSKSNWIKAKSRPSVQFDLKPQRSSKEQLVIRIIIIKCFITIIRTITVIEKGNKCVEINFSPNVGGKIHPISCKDPDLSIYFHVNVMS